MTLVVNLAPVTGTSLDATEPLAELIDPRAVEMLRAGDVLRCAAGIYAEIEANQTIEHLHERVRIKLIVMTQYETVLLQLERGVEGSRAMWHDRGCRFELLCRDICRWCTHPYDMHGSEGNCQSRACECPGYEDERQ